MSPRLLRFITLTALATSLLAQGVSRADDAARLKALAVLIRDPSPKVRVEALRALATIRTADSAALALSVLDQPMDPTLDYALWLTLNDLSEPWIAALQEGTWKPAGHEKQLEFALKAVTPAQASRVLGQLMAKQPLTADGTGPWIELIGAAGTPRELRAMYNQLLSGGFNDDASTRALTSLAEASRLRKARPDGDLSGLARLLGSPTESVQIAALRLTGEWKDVGALVPPITRLAGDPTTRPAVRAAAFAALRSLGGPGTAEALVGLTASADPSVRRSAAATLAAIDLGRATPTLVELARSPMPEAEAVEFWRSILAVKGAGKALTGALPESGLNPDVARAGMRVAREGGRSDLDLVVALARGAGLASDSTTAGAELIRELAAKAAAQGDPRRGESLYRRNDLACVSCHAIGGAGGRVGPDLTSIGASAPADYLVEAVLLPNAKIKEGYHSVILTTRDGTEFTGTLARETPEEVVLRTAAGAEQSVPKRDIAQREQGTLSLMPGGLIDPLDAQQQLDLFAFLSRLGKPGEYDAAQGGVARRWRLAQTVHTDAQSGQEAWPLAAKWDDRRWAPVYSLVNGSVTRELIDETTKAQAWTSRLGVYAATEATVATSGPVQFQFRAGEGAELWVDGRLVGGPGNHQVDLEAGAHRVIVKLDPKRIPPAIRLNSPDATFVLN